jgi:hypothetical protein
MDFRVGCVVLGEDPAVTEELIYGWKFENKSIAFSWLSNRLLNVRVDDANFCTQQFAMLVVVSQAIEKVEHAGLRALHVVIGLQALDKVLGVLWDIA